MLFKAYCFLRIFYRKSSYKILHDAKAWTIQKILEKIGLNVDSKAFSEFYSLQKKLNSFGYSAIDLR